MRIAYFVNVYPAISHSFIRREIRALEGLGVSIERIALRGWDGPLADPDDTEERAKTRYILARGGFVLLVAALRQFLRSPILFARAILLALRVGWRSTRPVPYHLVYVAEACLLLRWLQQCCVEHVHAHFGTNSTEVVMLARVMGGPPYSFTAHGPEEFDSLWFLGLNEKVRRASFVVAISSFARSQLWRLSRYEEWGKLHVVRCGLEKEMLEASVQPIPDSSRLICIGRLVEQKGHALLLQAMSDLAQKGVDCELCLVGDGPLESLLKRTADTLGIADRIEFRGALGGAELLHEIRRAKAMVLPSFAEGLPVTIMESFAIGRPVIATSIAGIPDLVRHGENGWLVPPGSRDCIVSAVQDVLSRSPQELEHMALLGRSRVIEMHAADREAAKLKELFHLSVASSGAHFV